MQAVHHLRLFIIVLLCGFAVQACVPPIDTETEEEFEFDLSVPEGAETVPYDDDFAGLGFTWDREMPGGGIFFEGVIGTCTLPGPWDIFVAVTGNLGPENFLHIVGEETISIPQTDEDVISGQFEIPMKGTLTDPDCYITYDIILSMTVEITPYFMHIVEAKAVSQMIHTSCPGLGVVHSPAGLVFPTDFVVEPMGPFECTE